MVDIMVDLETMSTSTRAAIVQIGAVAFDRGEREYPPDPPTYSANVDLQSCIDLGLQIDGATVMWWLGRSEEARASLSQPSPRPIREVMITFSEFVRHWLGRSDFLWSHGATFDVPILAEIYRILRLPCPWFFSRVHDTRTIYDLAGLRLPSADDRAGGHTALADARAQVDHLFKCDAVLAQRRGVPA